MRNLFLNNTFWIMTSFIICFSITDSFSRDRNKISVIFEGEEKTAAISSVQKSGIIYFSLKEFSDLLGFKHFTNIQNKKMVLRVGSQTIKVTSMNPFIMVDEMIYQMAVPTIEINEEIYVPLSLFLATVGYVFPSKFDFDRGTEILKIQRFKHNITAVEIEEKYNGTIIRFITTKQFKISDVATSLRRGWLNVTFYNGVLDSTGIASEKKIGIVDKIVPFQFETSAQISFLLNQEVVDRNIYVNEGEVLLALRNSDKLDMNTLNSQKEVRKRWIIDRIILDPGHGGKHPGAVGRSGLLEKEITLDIARRLKKLLIKRLEVDVLMTREDDKSVELKERTTFANAKSGKLFISIHADANKINKIRGFSTYFLGVAKTQEALEVAQRENSVIELEESSEEYSEFHDAAYILNAIAQSSYLKESQDLAHMVNESLKKRVKIPDLGVHQAGFYVLIGAAMPSILVETGFLSNSYEERLLKTRTFRQKIAEALCESIKRFKEKYEKGIG